MRTKCKHIPTVTDFSSEIPLKTKTLMILSVYYTKKALFSKLDPRF